MKFAIVLAVSLSCLVVGYNAAAVEPVVAEEPKDHSENAMNESMLPTNEGKILYIFQSIFIKTK